MKQTTEGFWEALNDILRKRLSKRWKNIGRERRNLIRETGHRRISFCPLYKIYEFETVTVQRGVNVWMQIFKDIFIEAFKKKNGDFPQSNKVVSSPTSPQTKALLSPEGLSGRADLDRRPHGPEPCALSGLSHAPRTNIIPLLVFIQAEDFPSDRNLSRFQQYLQGSRLGCCFHGFYALVQRENPADQWQNIHLIILQ